MTTDWNHLGADCLPILTCQTFNQILDNNSNTASSRPYLPGELEVGRRAWCPPTWASMVWGRSIKTMVMEVRRWARGKCQVGLLILWIEFVFNKKKTYWLGFCSITLICMLSIGNEKYKNDNALQNEVQQFNNKKTIIDKHPSCCKKMKWSRFSVVRN